MNYITVYWVPSCTIWKVIFSMQIWIVWFKHLIQIYTVTVQYLFYGKFVLHHFTH
jgi:hypothetical protein